MTRRRRSSTSCTRTATASKRTAVHHVNGPTYVEHHGLAAYVADEVQPSIDILTADGFEPVAFAHPYGAHTADIDAAVLERIQLVRSIAEVPLPHHDDH